MINHVAGVGLPQRANDPSPDPTWLSYWNSDRGDRWLIDVEESRDYVSRLMDRVPLHLGQTVLDFGCGSGLPAYLLAQHVGRVCLWDAAVSAQERARGQVAHLPNADLIDLSDQSRDPVGIFDLIVANSVVQYMSPEELQMWMRRWASMLTPGGAVVLSDVPHPGCAFVQELLEFLRFAWRRGFLLNALRHGLGDIANYRAARGTRPLMHADRNLFETMSANAGLQPEWLSQNLTFRRRRLSLVLRKRRTSQA